MVRPVELQDNLAKTQAAERVTQAQRTAAENDQRQAMMTVTQKAQAAQRQPTAPPQSDEVIIHREPDREDQDKKKKKKETPGQTQPGADSSPGETPDQEQTYGSITPPAPPTIHLDVKI
jgi:hypothetical protein